MKILLKVFSDFLEQSGFKYKFSYTFIVIDDNTYNIPLEYEYSERYETIKIYIKPRGKLIKISFELIIYGASHGLQSFTLSNSVLEVFIKQLEKFTDIQFKNYLQIKRKFNLNRVLKT